MPSGYGEFIFLDPLPFRCSLPFNLLRRGCIRMMHTAGKIGTNLYDLPAFAAVHDDSLGHFVAGFLEAYLPRARTVRLRLLDLQFQVAIAAQGAPSRVFQAEEICTRLGLASRVFAT